MRRIVVGIALILVAVSSFAQRPQPGERPKFPPDKRPEGRPPDDRPPDRPRCCAKVFDATGKEIGDVIRWDDRFPSVPLEAFVRYKLAGGDDVPLIVAPESISGTQAPGGSVALFTTPDCSGNDAFATVTPQLAKRQAVILPVGTYPNYTATHAWLWVSDPFPTPTTGTIATVFHSQWDNGACSPDPAPGFTFSGTIFGGVWIHRVKDLYAKYTRPFWIP